MPAGRQPLALIDALKALASQLIVLHHIAFYGPLSDVALTLAPGPLAWLSEYGRLAVQAFLVMGGFLAARALTPPGTWRGAQPGMLLWQRYVRLVLPFGVAVLLAIAANALARSWMQHDVTPAAAQWPQVLAHLTLLHSVLGVDSLSAGVWYVAIDFQLFALLLAIVWLSHRAGPAQTMVWRVGLTALLVLASLWFFNRDSGWDAWAPYFMYAYGLGALAWWLGASSRAGISTALMLAVVMAALVVAFRWHVLVATVLALLLGLAARAPHWQTHLAPAWIRYLARISYAVFLVHFPVYVVVSAGFTRFLPHTPWVSALGMLTVWAASVALGAVFHTQVEQRLGRWMARPRPAPLAQPAP